MSYTTEGLSREEVRILTEEGKSNKTEKNTSKTKGQIVKENVFTFFNMLFFFFAILVITTGKLNNLTFVIVAIINTAIGIFQELRSKSVLDKITVLTASKTKVIRSGEITEVDTESLVLGDLCIFTTGDQIGADATVVRGEAKLNEALVTGESDEIIKREGDELLSGSFVISGEVYGRLTHVGANSYVNRLTRQAKESDGNDETKMMKALSRLIKLIGIIMVPIGIAMFVQDMFWLDMGYNRTIESVVAALVGMIPEGLYLLTTIALTASVTKLAYNHVLVQKMASVETLARVDVLCLDKTGTLTENEMAFEKIVPLAGEATSDEVLRLNGILSNFVSVMGNDNDTMAALKRAFGDNRVQEADKIFAFTSQVKYSAAVFGSDTYILGAPEKLLLNKMPEYKEQISEYSKKGYRVLLFAKAREEILDGIPLSVHAEPLALVLLTNPVRKSAPATIKYFKKEGVGVKVISGDNPETVAAVAAKCGIEGSDRYIDASLLKTEEDIYKAIEKYNIFGRVVPAQKRIIVEALQARGKIVAMTGDGVNDVLALKRADCSVAIGQGAEVVKNVSKIVLLDSDFSHMKQVVGEGRQVVNNIQRSASLFLSKNIYSLLMAIFVIITGSSYPIYPTQMTYLSLVCIGIPGFFMSFEPCSDLIRGNFLVTILKKAMPAGLTNFVIITILTIISRIAGFEFAQSSTMSLILLIVVGITMLYSICVPFSTYRVIIFALTCVCAAGGLIILPRLFAVAPLTVGQTVLVVILGVIAVFMFFALTKLGNKIVRKIENSNFKYTKFYRVFFEND